MKIAIDCHTLEVNNWAGKEQLLASLLRSLEKIDLKNQYFLYFRRPVKEFLKLPENFKIINLNMPTPFWQIAVIIDLLKRKIKVLYVPCTYLLPALNFFIPQFINICDLTTFLPGISDTHKVSTKLRECWLLKMAIRNSKKISIISQSTKKDLLRFFKIKEDKTSVIYPGAKDIFKKIDNKNYLDLIIKKYNLPDKFILSVGTLEPRKNGSNLIKGFEKFCQEENNQNISLIFIGKKGWFYKNLLKQAGESFLNNKIFFLDYLSDEELVAFYNLAICLAYPSFYEGFGLPVAEAMACGCPVITSNISSMPEITGTNAFLVNPDKIDEISLGIKKMVVDDAYRKKLSTQGLVIVKNFTYQKMAEDWLKLINNSF